MKKPIILLSMFALILSACFNENPENEFPMDEDNYIERNPQEMAIIDELVLSGLDFPFGITRKSIQTSLGAPIRENNTEYKNMHDPSKTDIIHELYYEGLYFQIYSVSESGKDILLSLILSSDHYPVHFGLSIGTSKQAVIDTLGKPDAEKENVISYSASETVLGLIDFTFKENKITSIQWNFLIP